MPTVPLCPGCQRPMNREADVHDSHENRAVARWSCACGVTMKEGGIRITSFPPDYEKKGQTI